jgi:hypothetical protein
MACALPCYSQILDQKISVNFTAHSEPTWNRKVPALLQQWAMEQWQVSMITRITMTTMIMFHAKWSSRFAIHDFSIFTFHVLNVFHDFS